LEINPRDAVVWCDKGYALDELGRLEEAISCFDEALEINPRYAVAWGNKGVALAQTGRAEEAIFCLKRFIELAPDHPMADKVRTIYLSI
jgi:tetratricopeptide (TPR) repeat protein